MCFMYNDTWMKNTKDKITVTKAVRDFADIVNRVHYRGEKLTLTKGKKAVAQIIPIAQTSDFSGKDLKILFDSLPRLTPKESLDFENDLKDSKSKLLTEENPWDT